MSLARPLVDRNEVINDVLYPGDILAGGESLLAGTITTVGNGAWTAASIATGIIYRSGPTGAYTDTTDTAANILAALAGTAWMPDVVNNLTFRLTVINSVAYALTFGAGAGITTGSGVVNISASTWREYLVTILNASQPQQFQMTGNNGSPNIYFGYTSGTSGAAPSPSTVVPLMGSNGPVSGSGVFTATPGATVTGTNIAASATVIGLIHGQGGVIGVTLSGNNSGAVNGAISFGPTLKFDGIRSGTL